MRKLFIVVALFLVSQVVFAVSSVQNCNIISTLRLGSKGDEVKCLQNKIGVVADGNFGRKTELAVMNFQLKNGLTVDGIAGALSRIVLNRIMADSAIYPEGCAGTNGYSVTTGKKCDGSSNSITNNNQESQSASISSGNTGNTDVINSNLANLDQFIKTVVEVNRKKGVSEKDLNSIADIIRKVGMNSGIDYNKKFEELLVSESKLSVNFDTRHSLDIFDKVISKTISFLGITPSVAEASAGLPFGGRLLSSFYCPVSQNWMITITPLPPTYVAILSYTPGTQGFASYNIPFSRNLLGTYTPPGYCIVPIPAPPYFFYIPGSEGTILPMTGSSPL